jgi:tetratricopeptide (TPR) repeat protein
VTGTNLDVLVQKAAEAVFRRAQPYRYSRYLSRFVDRRPESVAVMQVLTKSGNITDRVWSWAGLSLTWAAYGAFPRSLDDARRAQALDPQSAVPYQSLQNLYYDLGQSEEELAADRAMSERTRSAGTSSISLRTLPVLHAQADAWTAELLGDYQAALRLDNAMAQMPDYQGSANIAPFNAAIDFAWAHDGNQARAALASADPESDPYSPSAAEFAWGLIRLGIGDWRGVIAHMTQSEQDRDIAAKAADPRADTRHYHRVDTGPQIALALAMLGEKAKTAAMLKTLPLDCYVCTRMRGRIDAEHMNWGGATYWFVEAIRQGPSLPFAYADWGAMLLRKGDYDAAIAKFRAANLKGPQFADPLEMWGEALMLKNRSDLALAKFEEANKHAPNWGRLHLKWGEALFYAGRQDEARKQFGQAANLDLSASDQSELARVRHG